MRLHRLVGSLVHRDHKILPVQKLNLIRILPLREEVRHREFNLPHKIEDPHHRPGHHHRGESPHHRLGHLRKIEDPHHRRDLRLLIEESQCLTAFHQHLSHQSKPGFRLRIKGQVVGHQIMDLPM
ncbi:MAG TPA: hypothetical protein DHU75_01390 [Rikenellaceae bacterium]|nr:hypothetical protein [Rikenellaceae bacterium]